MLTLAGPLLQKSIGVRHAFMHEYRGRFPTRMLCEALDTTLMLGRAACRHGRLARTCRRDNVRHGRSDNEHSAVAAECRSSSHTLRAQRSANLPRVFRTVRKARDGYLHQVRCELCIAPRQAIFFENIGFFVEIGRRRMSTLSRD